MHWVDFTSAAVLLRPPAEGCRGLLDAFRERCFAPVMRSLGALASGGHAGGAAACALGGAGAGGCAVVAPYLGNDFTRVALRAVGVQVRSGSRTRWLEKELVARPSTRQ
mmetsp:Transcript_110610/g.312922  ORF Transcript_110610/g.312922 Transcript_110610/m.312922 type:complete len:109 (+) Transcript_110610:455-781(+)